MDTQSISALFDSLKGDLVPIVQQILHSKTKPDTSIFKGFPVEVQCAFLTEVTSAIGFNYQRRRIDVSLHPFCSGNGG